MIEPPEPPEERLSEESPRGTGELVDDHAADLARWEELVAENDLGRFFARLDQDLNVALERRTIERMRVAATLLDVNRLLLAAAARLVYHAEEFHGAEPLGAWVEARIDQAIEDLVSEDEIEERDDRPVASDDPRYLSLASSLRVDPRTFRRGAVVFHRLPLVERAAFWAHFVDGKSIDRHAAEARVPLRIARLRLERAITTFCTLGRHRDPGHDDGPRQRRGDRP